MNVIAHSLMYGLDNLDIALMPDSKIVIAAPYDGLYSQRFPNAMYLSPYAGEHEKWLQAGHKAYTPELGLTDVFVMQFPQQQDEAASLMAFGLAHTRPSGLFMVAAENLAGGKTLAKRLLAFGCPTQDLSKHKCRIVWTRQPQAADKTSIMKALATGEPRRRQHGDLITQAGVFSCEALDKGTEVFLPLLPFTLSGNGADFGCGIGDIAVHILKNCPAIQSLSCLDHDQRSVACCVQNTLSFSGKVTTRWVDIPSMAPLSGLDFIVMNPPFHTGKSESKDLGKAFISKAAQSLRKGGVLYMVANSHLPYEDILQSSFSRVVVLGKDNGFKIFEAVL